MSPPPRHLSDDQDGNLYLFAAAGGAIRTQESGAVEQRLRAYFFYAASRAEADHLALECIKRDARLSRVCGRAGA